MPRGVAFLLPRREVDQVGVFHIFAFCANQDASIHLSLFFHVKSRSGGIRKTPLCIFCLYYGSNLSIGSEPEVFRSSPQPASRVRFRTVMPFGPSSLSQLKAFTTQPKIFIVETQVARNRSSLAVDSGLPCIETSAPAIDTPRIRNYINAAVIASRLKKSCM